jgi:hypothetical protein
MPGDCLSTLTPHFCGLHSASHIITTIYPRAWLLLYIMRRAHRASLSLCMFWLICVCACISSLFVGERKHSPGVISRVCELSLFKNEPLGLSYEFCFVAASASEWCLRVLMSVWLIDARIAANELNFYICYLWHLISVRFTSAHREKWMKSLVEKEPANLSFPSFFLAFCLIGMSLRVAHLFIIQS